MAAQRTHSPSPPRLSDAFSASRLIGIAALAVALAATASEAVIFHASRQVWQGQLIAEGSNHFGALDRARQALRWNPDDRYALYLEAVKLKRTDQWDALRERLPHLMAVHPSQASIRRLAGEDAFRRGEHARAADLLWEALWMNPTPPGSPAAFWRMTFLASEQAGRSDEALKALVRAFSVLDEDAFMPPADRRNLLIEAAAFYDRHGASETAAYLRHLADPEPVVP